MEREDPGVQAVWAGFLGEGWRSPPPEPRVVPASAAPSALAVLITVMTLWQGGAVPSLLSPQLGRAEGGPNPLHPNEKRSL